LHLVTFNQDGNSIEFSFEEDGYALLVSGEPINEKIETHGPFVMNTTTQIMESYRDYQMGKMGVLIET
jgi:redox-sensitive bicupin YhaK (pirin superfamily)